MEILHIHVSAYCDFRAEEERRADLAERDALAERIKQKDAEKTRKIVEKSDKKARLYTVIVLISYT